MQPDWPQRSPSAMSGAGKVLAFCVILVAIAFLLAWLNKDQPTPDEMAKYHEQQKFQKDAADAFERGGDGKIYGRPKE